MSGVATRSRSLNQVERGVEEALQNFVGRRPDAAEVLAIPAADRIEKIGTISARAIMEACETTAKDIEHAGQSAVDIAAEIMNEARQLAAGLRQNGRKISEHLQEFAVLARKVSTTMRDTRAEVLNPSEVKPPEA
jgi:vacuolar-type H+-ATPase subunit H